MRRQPIGLRMMREDVAGQVPQPQEMVAGQMAINLADDHLYYVKEDGSIGAWDLKAAGCPAEVLRGFKEGFYV